MDEGFVAHQLSPSSWSRYEDFFGNTGFPDRDSPKASMPASMGTAVHNSVEDLCNLDIEDRGPDEVEWLLHCKSDSR